MGAFYEPMDQRDLIGRVHNRVHDLTSRYSLPEFINSITPQFHTVEMTATRCPDSSDLVQHAGIDRIPVRVSPFHDVQEAIQSVIDTTTTRAAPG